jgi:anti-anti-sigma factor
MPETTEARGSGNDSEKRRLEMTFSNEKHGSVVVLGMNGRVDVEGSNAFLAAVTEILDGGALHVLLDFSEVSYINSQGLRVLLQAVRRLASSGGKLILAGVSDPIQKVLAISGLTSFFVQVPTRAEGLASFPS